MAGKGPLNMGGGNSPFTNMLNFMNGGGNPQQVMQMLMSKNPNFNNTMQQLQNMANGKSPKDFAMQLIRQNGLDEKQAMELAKRLGAK